jgi:hypothetical protein
MVQRHISWPLGIRKFITKRQHWTPRPLLCCKAPQTASQDFEFGESALVDKALKQCTVATGQVHLNGLANDSGWFAAWWHTCRVYMHSVKAKWA